MGTGSMGTNAIRRTMSGAHAHGEYEDERDGKGASGNSGGGYKAGSEPAALGPGMISLFPFPHLTKNLTRRSRFPQHTTNAQLTPHIALCNLTFSLAPGWKFIETEDWRVDYDAGAGAGVTSTFKEDKVASPLSTDAEDGDGGSEGDEDADDDDDGGDEDDLRTGMGSLGDGST
ncbi:hypothetical protein D9758_009273 [Tetrapyrgos nigripes]|uniref:Uncharacterized protein n=1 Tax=Tetrapyrgos nigripes TaxID=182062 RepID=A0A8H5FX56_9AGAR|nr:hypothetical protein D9758_009273 [Tetrapyrgos nigripes]